MLKDATGFKKIYIAAGKTDLRKGMDSLAAIVSLQFHLDPYETNILFLFCGSSRRLIKGLVWEGDGFVLLTKRLQNGVYQWPRDSQEVMDLTQKQFADLMNGLSVKHCQHNTHRAAEVLMLNNSAKRKIFRRINLRLLL